MNRWVDGLKVIEDLDPVGLLWGENLLGLLDQRFDVLFRFRVLQFDQNALESSNVNGRGRIHHSCVDRQRHQDRGVVRVAISVLHGERRSLLGCP